MDANDTAKVVFNQMEGQLCFGMLRGHISLVLVLICQCKITTLKEVIVADHTKSVFNRLTTTNTSDFIDTAF